LIAVIVNFKLPNEINLDEVITKFDLYTAKWCDNPDLI